MSQLSIRLSALAMTALLAVPLLTSVAAASGTRHAHSKKHSHWRHAGSWAAGRPRPFAAPTAQSGPVCPAIGRSFECKIWPPPFADDPDRKVSKY
jgi:hypothetical protein